MYPICEYLRVAVRRFTLGTAMASMAASSSQAQNGTVRDARCTLPITGWSIVLDGIDPAAVRRSTADLVIIDATRDGRPSTRFSRQDVAQMKVTPSGGRRLVIGYISMGQAESYRSYWQASWDANPPDWIGPADDQWHNNFEIRFWQSEWQALVYGSPDAMLDKLLDAGFDGIMLDGADAFEFWEDDHPSAPNDMIAFISNLASYARAQDPQFLILPLNSENLLANRGFAGVIDGIIKEDLFYGWDHRPDYNPQDEIDWSLAQLGRARESGLPVFVIEYLPEGDLRDQARAMIDRAGFLASFGERALQNLSDTSPAAPGAINTFARARACRNS